MLSTSQSKKRSDFPFFVMAISAFLLLQDSVGAVQQSPDSWPLSAMVTHILELLVFIVATLTYLNLRDSVKVKFGVLDSADTIPGLGDIAPSPGIYVINRKRHAIRVEELWAEDEKGNRLQYIEFRNRVQEIETPRTGGIPSVQWIKEWPRTISPDQHYAFPTIHWPSNAPKFIRGVIRYDLNKKKRSKKFKTSIFISGSFFVKKKL